jgi:hypothetical protein
MSDIRTGTVTSADGTAIVFDQSGGCARTGRRHHQRRETIRPSRHDGNIAPAMTGLMEHRAGWTSGQTRHSHDQASRADVI